MTNSLSFDQFKGISALLTGFTQDQLFPSIDPIEIGQTYYDTLLKETDKTLLTQFAAAVEAVLVLPPNQQEGGVQKLIIDNSDLVPIARSIITMWYLGSWDGGGDSNAEYVISSQAYVNGLVWKVARAHPMGYSQFHYGYWAQEPDAYEGTSQGGAS